MRNKKSLSGIDLKSVSPSFSSCEPIIAGKVCLSGILSVANVQARGVIEIIYSDVYGSLQIRSKIKAGYFVTFIVKFSH